MDSRFSLGSCLDLSFTLVQISSLSLSVDSVGRSLLAPLSGLFLGDREVFPFHISPLPTFSSLVRPLLLLSTLGLDVSPSSISYSFQAFCLPCQLGQAFLGWASCLLAVPPSRWELVWCFGRLLVVRGVFSPFITYRSSTSGDSLHVAGEGSRSPSLPPLQATYFWDVSFFIGTIRVRLLVMTLIFALTSFLSFSYLLFSRWLFLPSAHSLRLSSLTKTLPIYIRLLCFKLLFV